MKGSKNFSRWYEKMLENFALKNRRKYPSAGKCMPSALVDIASLKGDTFQVNDIISCGPVTDYIISYLFWTFSRLFLKISVMRMRSLALQQYKNTTFNYAKLCEIIHIMFRVRGVQRCPRFRCIDTESSLYHLDKQVSWVFLLCW